MDYRFFQLLSITMIGFLRIASDWRGYKALQFIPTQLDFNFFFISSQSDPVRIGVHLPPNFSQFLIVWRVISQNFTESSTQHFWQSTTVSRLVNSRSDLDVLLFSLTGKQAIPSTMKSSIITDSKTMLLHAIMYLLLNVSVSYSSCEQKCLPLLPFAKRSLLFIPI